MIKNKLKNLAIYFLYLMKWAPETIGSKTEKDTDETISL